MKFRFKCIACLCDLEASTNAIGQQGTCSKCGHSFTVPAPNVDDEPDKSSPANDDEREASSEDRDGRSA